MTAKPFAKALDLMRLAEMAAARTDGVSLALVCEAFDVNLRTAQRMLRALEMVFPRVRVSVDDERHKWWKLGDEPLMHQEGIRDSELAALEMGIRRAEREGAVTEVAALGTLRDRLLATMPAPFARRAEVDAEAVLEARGHACRPGPRAIYDPHLLGAIETALKGPFMMEIQYVGAQEATTRARTIEPYGVLVGVRSYLVAREPETDGTFRHFRLDRIRQATILPQTFRRDPEFNLRAHAARSFGSFHSEAERGDVVWLFTPEAAPVAGEFSFHSTQVMEPQPDGSLIVRFTAGGLLEMAWHLYQWGDQVQVLEPPVLREMVEGYRRGDFPALP